MIINAPLRSGVNIGTWNLSKVTKVCNGGTWSEDPNNFATDAQLNALAASGKEVVYSVCLKRTPAQELAEVNRYISKGITINSVRLGNEESQDSSLDGVWQNAAFAFGESEAEIYFNKAQLYSAVLPYSKIYSGEFPSNQQGVRFKLFREGWNSKLISLMGPTDRLDMHIYQNYGKVEIDLSYFDTVATWPNGVVIIESGVASSTITTSTDVYTITVGLWTKIRAKMRSIDEFGLQLMENLTSNIGLVFNGALTPLGEWINGLYINGEEPGDPVVRVVYVHYLFPAWISGIYSYGLYDLSDGRKRVFAKSLKSEALVEGSIWVN